MSKTFKHVKTGIIGKTTAEDSFLHFKRWNGDICANESISMELIEESNEWVEVEDAHLPTKYFKTEQIKTWIGEPLTTEGKEIAELNGGEGTLIVLHQCGEDKQELISQLECMIHGVRTNFKDFAQ